MKGTLYILTGPSGVGKTTVAKELLAQRDNLVKVVTCTTRTIRDEEIDSRDYNFISEEEFKKHIEDNEMYEWAHVYGNYYGSRKADVDELITSGKDVLMVVDVQGARELKKQIPEAQTIFLEAESPEVLIERLERRDQGKTVNIEERREAFNEEMAYCTECQHRVINKENKLETTVKEIIDMMEV